jgi:hypothetical protein
LLTFDPDRYTRVVNHPKQVQQGAEKAKKHSLTEAARGAEKSKLSATAGRKASGLY